MKNNSMKLSDGGLLLYGNSYDNPDLYYATEFLISDCVLYLRTEERDFLVTNEMEEDRARDESKADEVLTAKKMKLKDELEGMTRVKRKARIIEELIERYCNSERLYLTEEFPTGIYKEIEDKVETEVVECPFSKKRALKDEAEIEKISRAQSAARAAIEKVKQVLGSSEEDGERLIYEDEVLTQGKVKKIIHHELLDRNCSCEDLIVSSGSESSFPHKTGEEGKAIVPGTPVIVDVFPYGMKERYHGDMTRTLVKGETPDKITDMYKAVVGAQRKALELLKPGIKASEVDKAVCEFLEDKGYSTRLNSSSKAEFKHSTGHGVGLEVHEKPHVGKGSDYELKPGNVVAIEPGLYNEKGGVRVEDIVVIREEGCEIIEGMSKSLEV